MSEHLMSVFRANLSALIEATGSNPRAVSLKAGMGHTGVKDILSGKARSPKLENVARLADALGVSVSTLLGEDLDAAMIAEAAALFRGLSPQDRRRLLATARAWASDAPGEL